MQLISMCTFGLALIHSFLAPSLHRRFQKKIQQMPLLIFVTEIELVFFTWLLLWSLVSLSTGNLTDTGNALTGGFSVEILFVFAISLVSSQKSFLKCIVHSAELLASKVKRTPHIVYFSVTFGVIPFTGSLISEPAAMIIAASLSLPYFASPYLSIRAKHVLLALLFINVSIGGSLTSFAAPPIVLVAAKWDWDSFFVFKNLGLRFLLPAGLNMMLVYFVMQKGIRQVWEKVQFRPQRKLNLGFFITFASLILVIFFRHSAGGLAISLAVFLFLNWILKVETNRDGIFRSLKIAVFLYALVTLGQQQRPWVEELLAHVQIGWIFSIAATLTAFIDNAAVTYIGSMNANGDLAFRIQLAAGALAGGGLTLLANAPNIIGYEILKPHIEKDGFKSLQLFYHALWMTLIVSSLFIF